MSERKGGKESKSSEDLTARDINRDAWDHDASIGGRWSQPVTPEQIREARNGEWSIVLTESKSVPRHWFGDEIEGREVLCLASAGGQQVPILAAAGARVTSLDNSPGQLSLDREVVEREGLDVTFLEGDMRDLSPFHESSFDLVFHPCSNLFVPDVRAVWRECFRVLRPGGALLAGFLNPMEFIFDFGKEEEGLLEVAHSLPFSSLEFHGEKWLRANNETAVFSHSFEAQIGGQLEAGLQLTDLYEAPRDSGPMTTVFPSYIATRAIKPS